MKQNTVSSRVLSELRARIRSGQLRPGDRVPSARQIVSQWGVALATAAKVLVALRRERLVRVVPGVGTIVRAAERGPDLTRARIVEAAVAIADDEGTAALSMRSVARELGVATMSLYRHVAGKDQLLLLMADAVFAEAPPPRKVTGGWRAQLEALARLQWATYRRHTWLASLISMSRPQLVPNGMIHTERVLEILDGLSLDEATTLRTAIAFIGHVRGIATCLESELDAERDTGLDRDEWMEAQAATFAPLMPRFPVLARLSQLEGVAMGLDALFDCGLACFLDGIEAQLGRRGRAR